MRIPLPQPSQLDSGRCSDQDDVPNEGIERGFIQQRDIQQTGPVPAKVVVEHVLRHGEAHSGVDDAVQDLAIAKALGRVPEDTAAEGCAVERPGLRLGGGGGLWGRE